MKRSLMATAASVGAAALLPAGASAQTIELGTTTSKLVAPTCPATVKPADCTIILTQVTALETVRDGAAYPTTVTKPGVLVAFTVGLSRLSSNLTTAKADVGYLNRTYGGTPRMAITVLKPVGRKRDRNWQVVAQTPIFHIQPYLGQIVQFPLGPPLAAGEPPMAAPLEVEPGEVVALTVPTWAPVLSFGLNTKNFAYRQSRKTNCTSPATTQQAQLSLNAVASYQCDYTGTRVEYSVTEITSPVPPKTQIH
jgi:hypothetical protein